MNEKFPYGYDVNIYIDKAFEQMKESYFWATKEMLNPEWTYAIEQDEDGEYQYVTYYDQRCWQPAEVRSHLRMVVTVLVSTVLLSLRLTHRIQTMSLNVQTILSALMCVPSMKMVKYAGIP